MTLVVLLLFTNRREHIAVDDRRFCSFECRTRDRPTNCSQDRQTNSRAAGIGLLHGAVRAPNSQDLPVHTYLYLGTARHESGI